MQNLPKISNGVIGILVIFILFILLATGGFFYVYRQIQTPAVVVGSDQTIVIERGLSIKQIAARLENAGIIRGTFYFESYVYLENITNLQAGEYILNPAMNIPEIAAVLSGGLTAKNEVKITIPEGFTVKQIDDRLAEAGLIQPNELVDYKIPVPSSQFPVSGLEGYLFPDTYFYSKNVGVEKITEKMLENFNKKITPEMRAEIERQKRTLNDVVILASIVQQEAVSVEEMPKIAGVYYNRLAINMPLQSDPTVNYATGKSLRQPTYEDTQVDSLYNTYKYKGLPPGPICNPGLDAIKAAIWPEKHDYFYFLHPLDAPTVFSKTEAEHRENKAKWLK